jgi:DNA mismatch repair ATPase MutS
MLIRNGTVKVRKYEGQEDHTVQILQLFEKFRENPASEYQREISPDSYAPHIENAVLDMVAKLYRDIFSDLDRFCVRRLGFPDPTIVRFSREVQFYLSWLEYISPFAKSGLPFCFPAVRAETDRIEIRDGFDLALASSLQTGKIVVNDFLLEAPERIIVVTGPNQGGKTTYARAFGQIHYLGALGLCVPAKEAVLILFDTILTHFEREENFLTENGKLQDDVVRLKAVFDAATAKSIVIINEIFSSTTAADAVILGNAMMDILAARGCPALCVTFLDELARHGKETVSMMSTVRPDAPASRTYKIIRKPPDGLAYAIHIAEKYGLTYEKLRGRLA